MTTHTTRVHMVDTDNPGVVIAHAECSCGWVGENHTTDHGGDALLNIWIDALVDRNIHNSTTRKETA